MLGVKVWVYAVGVLVSMGASWISPAPWSATSTLVSGRALLRRKFLIWSGVIVGYFWASNATVPDTTAAAWLVPDPRK